MLVPRSMFHLHEVADPDSDRYALGGVRIVRTADGKPQAAATDGRRMLVAQWEEDPADEYPTMAGCDPSPNGNTLAVTIPREVCRKAVKLAEAAKKSPKAILARNVALDEHAFKTDKPAEAQDIPLGATDLADTEVITARTQPGRFPQYEDVFISDDRLEAGVRVELDAAMLQGLLATMRKLMAEDPSDERGLVLTVVDHQTGVYLTYQGERTKAAGCIMPLCNNDETPPAVGWVPRRPGAQAKPEADEPAPAFSVETALHVVADSWDKLRAVDVERLLDGQAPEHRATVAAAIAENRPDLGDRVRGVLSAYAHPSNQAPKPPRNRQKRLLKELDDLRGECFERKGHGWEALAEQIRVVYAAYAKVPWDDTKSLDNCEECVQRFRERLGQAEPKADGSEARRRSNGVIKVDGTYADGTFEVYPKKRVVIARSKTPAVLTLELGASAFYADGSPGQITTIGPKLVAVTDGQGKAHWLTVEAFVDFNQDNG